MGADATNAYITASAAGKDAAILCNTWEIADTINQRLRDHYTRPNAASVRVSRDQLACVGDLIISRSNDATVAVQPGAHGPAVQVDQVRNGNRWRVLAVAAERGEISAGRLSDGTRVLFEGDYRREHLTLGYASTVHSAQGMTIGSATQARVCWPVLADGARRAMAYVKMTRGRDATPSPCTRPSSTRPSPPLSWTATSNAAPSAHGLGSRHTAEDRAREAAYQRITVATREVGRERSRHQGYGLEL